MGKIASGHLQTTPFDSWAEGLAQIFARVVVFRIDGRFAEGVSVARGVGIHVPGGCLARGIRVDLTQPTPLRWALEAASPVVGSGRAPYGDVLSRALGWSMPRVYCAVPLISGDRIVAIAYADNESKTAAPGAIAAVFARCASLLGDEAFQSLHSSKKTSRVRVRNDRHWGRSPSAKAQRRLPSLIPLTPEEREHGGVLSASIARTRCPPPVHALTDAADAGVTEVMSNGSDALKIGQREAAAAPLIKPELPAPLPQHMHWSERRFLEERRQNAVEFSGAIYDSVDHNGLPCASQDLDAIYASAPELERSGQFVVTPQGLERRSGSGAGGRVEGWLSRRTVRMPRVFSALLIVALILLGIMAPVLWALSPTGVSERVVTIPPSSTVAEMAAALHEAQAIRSPWLFRWWTRLRNIDSTLRAGTYRLSGEGWLWSVADELQRGQVATRSVTVPEGLTLNHVATLFEREGIASAAEIQAAARSAALLERFGVEAASLEGFLFPETYTFAVGLPAEEIVSTMVKQFFVELQHAGGEGVEGQVLVNKVILASIIEREAVEPSEVRRIAGVFQNRIEQHMRLESCATVQYVLGKPKDRLLFDDLRIPSPYNTYLHEGLPPGPIANPGRLALSAALNPEQHDYKFFVARGDGSHRHTFSRDFVAHQAAQRQAKREQRQRAGEATL